MQLRREKQKVQQTKRGFGKSKPVITSGSAIVRVLYKEEEVKEK